MNSSNVKGIVTSSCSTYSFEKCSLRIVMPIYDELGNNYDIVATYIYNKNELTYNKGSSYGFEIN